ncbi:MAG: sigma-70 family RNA polymerase sigma factor, partial [Planctomycetota bacterium]|nr:sigma-70 family RNA polymerase sigma factor [Planctomycetota bacterium]
AQAIEQDIRDLVRQAREGSEEAFGKVVERVAPRLIRFLRGLGFSLHDAEDLAQDALLAAYEALPRYDERYAFVTWMFTIARRLAISAVRRRRCAEDYAAKQREAMWKDQPRGEAAAGEIWEWARRSLPERDYEALWLRYGEGLAVQEIATVMAISAIHVRVLLHRGRQRLSRAAAATAASAAPCLEGRW